MTPTELGRPCSWAAGQADWAGSGPARSWAWPLGWAVQAGVGKAHRGVCRSGCRLWGRRRRGPCRVPGLGSLVRSPGAVPASRGVGGAQEKTKGSLSGTHINQWTGRREAAEQGPTDGRAEIQVHRGCPGDLGKQPGDKAGLRTKRKTLAAVVIMRVP